MKAYILLLFTIFSLLSCGDEVSSKLTPKPIALGRLNDVVVIADDNVWEGAAGDEFRYYYESAFPIMPTPEPLFDIRHFTPEDLSAEPLRRELRTYIIVANFNDKDSPTTKMVRRDLGEEKFKRALSDTTFISTAGMDKWAREQLVAYVFGNSIDGLSKNIRKTFPAIADRIKKHDNKQLSSNVFNLQNEDIQLKNLLKNKFGIDIRIPDDYKKKVEESANFVFLKKDFRDYSQNIVIRKFPYTSESQFSIDSVVAMRNDYGKKFISGTSQNSYMVTNTTDLPIYEYTYDLNGSFTKEVRGLWELVNDFIGGPFVSYLILNKETNEIIFIDTFVYAPSRQKRDLVQQLEYIAKTTKMINTSPSE